MSKTLTATVAYNGEVIDSFDSIAISLNFPGDRAGIVSSANALAHVVLTTDAQTADDLPTTLVSDAIDTDDEGELVLTEDLPGEESLSLTLSRFVVESNQMGSAADGTLAMTFHAVAATVATPDATFTSEREFL